MAQQSKLSINKNNVDQWKTDVQKSVLYYNEWFLKYAPSTYIKSRQEAIAKVETIFQKTDCLNMLSVNMLKEVPDAITILRMATTPPLARDRLVGLADIPRDFIKKLEEGTLPSKLSESQANLILGKIIAVVNKILDKDIMPWLEKKATPNEIDRLLAKQIIGDRVCGSLADPLIRNEQERRQLSGIKKFLIKRGYRFVESKDIKDFKSMEERTFTFHLNVPVKNASQQIKMPIDVVVKRKNSSKKKLPLLIECKSAGDFTNTNKRRKEEATKIEQLKNTYGNEVEFILYLCGYFDTGYLGYEAAEGIDWVWEHRIEDLLKAGV